MAWAKTACWSDIVGTSSTYAALAAAATSSGSIATGDYVTMMTQVYYSASTAASQLNIDWLGVNHNGPSLTDTQALFSAQLTGVNGASVKSSYDLFIGGLDGIAISCSNLENTDTACVWISVMFGGG